MQSKSDRKHLRNLVLERLEDRTLFDAASLLSVGQPETHDGVCSVDDCASHHRHAELPPTQIVFVDERIDDKQELLRDLVGANLQNVDVFYLSQERSGVAQMTRILAGYEDVSAIHIVSHGNDGAIQLGADWLDVAAANRYSNQFASWQNSLSGSADLFIYGCDLASNSAGRALMQQMSKLTSADVAASDDLTGSAELGGDWDLEVHIGDVDGDLAFAPFGSSWSGLLAVEAGRDIVTVQDAVNSTAGSVSLADNAALIDVTSSNTPERVVQMLQRVWTYYETADVGAATYVFDITGITGILGSSATDFALIRSTQVDLVAGTTDVLLASGFDSVNNLVYFHAVDLNDGEFFALATKVETNSFSISPTTTTLEDTPVNIGVTVDPALLSGGTLQDIIGTDIGFRASSAGSTSTDFVIPAGTMGIRITGYSTRDTDTSAIDSQNDDYQTLYATIDLTTETSDGFNAYIIDRGVARSDQFGWEDAPLGASVLTGGGTVTGDTSNSIDPTFRIVDGVLQIVENHPLQTAYHVEFLTTIESSSNFLGVASAVRDQGDTSDIVISIDPNADFLVITEADAATDGGDYRVEYKGFGRIVLDLTTLRASGTLVAERGEGAGRNTAYSFSNYDASSGAVGSIQSSGATIVGDTTDSVSSNNDLQFFLNASGDLVIRRESSFAGVFNSLFSVEFYERLAIGSQANALETSFDRQFFVADVTGPVHTLNFDVPDGAVLGIMNLSMSNQETDDVNENMGAGYAIIDLTNGITSGSLYNIRVGGTVDFVAWSDVMFGTEFFDANGDSDPNSSMNSNHTLISQFVDEWSGNAALNIVNNPDGTQSVTYTSYNNQSAASFKNYWTAAQIQWYGIQPFELSGYPANGSFDKGQLNTTTGNWEVSINDVATGLTYIPGTHYSGFDPINVSFRLGQETESTTVIVQAVLDPVTFSTGSVSGPEDSPLSISAGVAPIFVDTDGSESITGIQLSSFAIGHGITDGTYTFVASAGNTSIDITGWNRASLNYLPALDAVGTFDLDVTATFQDVGGGVTDTGSITETLSIVITNINDNPNAVDDFYITADGEVLTATLGTNGLLNNDSDPDIGDILSVTTTPIIGPANGMVVINTNGTFTYTPTPGFVGNDSFVYEVLDGNGGTAQATARIVVAPPILCDLTDLWDLTGSPHAEADFVGIDLTTVSAGGSSFGAFGNETFNTIPAFADLMASGHDSLSVNFVWDPTPETGPATGGTGTLTFTFAEPVVNPEFNLDRLGDAFGGISNSALLTLLTPGLTLERLSGPAHFEVDALAGTIQRTPNQILAGGATEQSSMDPTMGSAAGSVRIVGTVTTLSFQLEGVGPEGLGFDVFELSWCVNAAPRAGDDADSTLEETTVNIDVLTNDSDSLGEPFVIVATTDPANGSIVVNSDLTIDYTPDTNFYGVDTFAYTIQDANGGTSSATVTITVTNTQDAPAALPDSAITDEDVPVIIDVLANDVDPDPDTLTVTGASALNGTVTISPGGTITYTPSANWSGTDTITYTMSDGAGGTDTTTATVTVVPVADAPTSANVTKITTEDTEYVFTLADFLFDDNDTGDTFTEFRIDSIPTAGSLSFNGADVSSAPLIIVPADIAAGRLVFISDPNASGLNYSFFTFSVGDGSLFSLSPNTVTFDVLATNDPPTTGNNTVSILEDTNYVFALADFPYADTESDPIAELRIDSLPAFGILRLNGTPVAAGQLLTIANLTNGDLVYQSTADANGTTSFTFSPSDGTVFSESPGVITINVTPVNDAPAMGSVANVTLAENTINAAPQFVDAAAGLPTDIDSTDFAGGSLSITYTVGGSSDDQLSIFDQGIAAGEIGFDGTTVTFGGVAIGTVAGVTNGSNGQNLVIAFTSAQATPTAVQALLRNLTYANTSNGPVSSRTISLVLVDGDGVIDGGADTSAAELATIDVTAQSDTVSIIANDPTAAEPTDNAQFTVSLAGTTAVDIAVSYSVTGTATSGSDFATLTGSVTILAGSNSATINLAVINDNIVEGIESITVTLTGASPDVTIDALNDSATATIADNDSAELSIVATLNAAEPSTGGQFTVSLSNTSSIDTVVAYTVNGDATAGSDLTALSGSVTILAGQLSATIDVSVLDDLLLEDDETVIVTLSSITSGDPDVSIGTTSSASISLVDNDTALVTVTANDPNAAEPGNQGQFTVSLSNLSDTDTVVSYSTSGTAVAGSDYNALSGTVTILAGQVSATIDVNVLDSPALEADETVVVTLTGITSGDTDISIGTPNEATVTIVDDDSAELSIAANDAIAAEPGNDGQFTVTQSATSLVDTIVAYSLSGTALNGADFAPLTGTVTIAAGSTTAFIDITILDDSLVELTETLTITLDSITAGASALFIGAVDNDLVTITDSDSAEVTLVANDPTAAEPSDNGQFTLTLSNASSTDTTISYSVAGSATSGVDFALLTGSVTISAGTTSTVIDVSVIDTALLESSETVDISLTSITAGDADIVISGTANSATVTIADDDTAAVTIAATTQGAEPTTAGQFTVSLSSASDTDTTVSYSVTGSATAASDYSTLTGSVTILAGDTSATIDVAVLEDTLLEGNETVIVTLSAITSGDADVSIGATNSATLTITDDDMADITITANDPSASEPANDGQFTVSLSQSSTTDTVVSYILSGSATSALDFTALTGSVTILANQLTATIDVSTIDDNVLESSESLIVTLNSITSGNSNILIGAANSATVTIADDDASELSIIANDSTASEPGNDGQFTVSLSNVSDTDTVVAYSVGGSATAGSDFISLSGTLTIIAGNSSATIDVSVIDNIILESDETVTVTLDSVAIGDADISIGATNTATVNIADNETATVTIAPTLGASEPATDGQFTVSLSNASDTDTVLAYTVTGDAIANGDYSALSGSITILAGSTFATIDVNVLDDLLLEDNETVTVTLNSISSGDADISVGFPSTANLTIADNDSALVTIAATLPTAAEPSTDGQFTVTLSNVSDTDTVVSYLVSGDATSGSDFTALAGTVTILAGDVSALINVSVLDDSILEDTETLTVTLNSITSGDVDISIGATSAASVTITDNDTATVSIVASDASAAEPTNDGQFTVSLSAISDTDTVVSYTISGDASSVTDFAPLSGSVTIIAGNTNATIDVSIVDDSLLEDLETVTLTLGAITAGDADISIAVAGVATISIADDDSATVSLAASDPNSTEPVDPGQFIVTLSAPSDTDTVITYTVSGDAAPGGDYTALSGIVTILAGTTTATIDVVVLDDSLLEDDETVTVTLNSISSGDVDVSLGAAIVATVMISDDDTAEVTIVANDASASEPANPGQFTVSLSNASDTDTVVAYSVTGDATAGADYVTLVGSITILAGNTTATIDVVLLDDSLLEDNETVTVTIDAITSGDGDISIGTTNAASVTISDNDVATASIAANDPNASEPSDDGQFTVTLTNTSDTDTVISYTVSGTATSATDFVALAGSVTIAAGDTTATIDLTTIDNNVLESNELVILTLGAITSGDADISIGTNNAATISISDDDVAVVTIVATDGNAAEPSDDGQFTVSMNNVSDTDTVVNFSVAGSASAGADYVALSGSVTILAGNTTATIDVAVLDESLLETTETVTVTLDSIASGDADISVGAANSATVNIADDDSAGVTIAANDATASEPGDSGQFTVALSNPSDTDTTISYTVTGDATAAGDYISLSGSVTILAGATTATIDVFVLDDAVLEPIESVTITLDSVTSGDANISIGASNSATVTIADDDSAQVTVSASDPTASEAANHGQFTLALSGISTSDTTISYLVSGPASAGFDYVTLSGSATITAGQSSVTIDVLVIDDAMLEGNEDLIITLNTITAGDPSIVIGATNTATVTIADNDSATITIAANDASATEPADNGQFTVTLSNISDSDTTVNYVVTGDATGGSDYSSLLGSVTILAGNAIATIDIVTLDDSILEDAESVVVTLDSIVAGNANINLGVTTAANVTISDDDSGLLSVIANDPIAAEPSDHGQFTVSLSSISDTDTTVSYILTGSAAPGSDFATLSGSATILAGATSATINVSVIDDGTLESAENVVITLTTVTSGDADVSIDTTADTATVNISDDDTAEVTIVANDASASEPANPGQFTVSLSNASDTDTVVAYSVTGDATAGADYVTLVGSITILAGNTTATIDVVLLDDSLLEDNETVTVTIDAITSGDGDISIGTTNAASVTISDNDVATASIAANDPNASEPSDDGQFTVTLTNTSDTDTVISYTVSGTATSATDFVALAGSVTIAAGDTTATIDLTTIDNNVLESNELVILTLGAITSGDADISIDLANRAASVTIADNDTAELSIAATDSTAGEPADNGQFTVTLSATSDTDTVISYLVAGTATSGRDFSPMTGAVTILAGDTTATIDVTALDDAILETTESVIVTLDRVVSGDADISIGATLSATITISDNDTGTVSVTASDATSQEPSNNGQFLVQLSNSAATDTTVSYSVGGTATSGSDYSLLSGSVTIAAGSTSALIDLLVVNDALLEGTETVAITLSGITSGDSDLAIDTSANTATVTISDDDTALVSIVGTDLLMGEPGNDGEFAITLSAASDTDTVVSYTVSGTATVGADFAPLSGSLTIMAGDTSATIDVTTVDDGTLEADESLTITIDSIIAGDTDISIGGANSATAVISDDDSATLIVSASDSTGAEPTDNAQFTLALSAPADSDTVVQYTVGGTATIGSDYTPLTGTITILAGGTAATIDVVVNDDLVLESNETLTLTIATIASGDSDITIDPTTATVTLADDDTAFTSITATDPTAAEPNNDGRFAVSLSAPSDSDTVVTYAVSGSAFAGGDYLPLTGSVTIAAGETLVTIDASILDDSLLEPTQSIIVTLTSVNNAAISIDPNANSATVTILDDDALTPVNLVDGSDTGSSNSDEITADNTPTLDVPTNTATPGDSVTIYADGTVVGTGVVLPDGSFVITTSALADGTYDMTYSVTDPSGTESATSPPLAVTIDTGAPTVPTVDTRTTNDTTPLITGTAILDSGKVLTVDVDGVTYSAGDGNLAVLIDGTWQLTIPVGNELSDGTYEVTATVTDLAGNSTIDVSTAELTIDLVAPIVDNRITVDLTPILTGQGSPGESLTISVDANGDGTPETTYATTVAADGTWQIDPDLQAAVSGAFPLLFDNDVLQVTATDSAGNLASGTITIDVSAPVVDDGFTDNVRPLLTGDGEPSETLTITVDADGDGTPEVTYRVTVDQNGQWQVDPSTDTPLTGSFPPVPGNTTLVVTAFDPAGNSDMGLVEIVPPSASISGRVYVDSNENGQFDDDETPLEGVVIRLDGTTSTGAVVSQTATTGSDGYYRFDGLYSGDYFVTQEQPDGFIDGAELPGSLGIVSGNDQFQVILAPAQQATNLTFTEGNLLASMVSKRWFLTSTGSGIYEDVAIASAGPSGSTPPLSFRADWEEPGVPQPLGHSVFASLQSSTWSRHRARSAFIVQSALQNDSTTPIQKIQPGPSAIRQDGPSGQQLEKDRSRSLVPSYIGWRDWLRSSFDRSQDDELNL